MLFFLLEKEIPEMYFQPPGSVFPRYFESGTTAKIDIFPRSPHTLTPSAEAIADPGMDTGVVLTTLFLLSFLESMSQHGSLVPLALPKRDPLPRYEKV